MAIWLRVASSAVCAAMALVVQCPAWAGDEIVDEPALRNGLGLADARTANGTGPTSKFDESDSLAALQGISIALNEVGDGGTYVWHRLDGRLSGMAQPHESFKNTAGQPCRRLVVMLNAFERSRRIDGIACRAATGRWQLQG